MALDPMSTLTIGDDTYEVVDETARSGLTNKADKVHTHAITDITTGRTTVPIYLATTGAGTDTTTKYGELRTTADAAAVSTTSAGGTGYLKITLPLDYSNTMIGFDVDVYSYTGSVNCTYKIGTSQLVKNPQTGAVSWVHAAAGYVGNSTSALANLSVAFGNNGATVDTRRPQIQIGAAATKWGICAVVIRNIVTFYNGYGVGNWDDGWTVEFTTTPLAVSQTTVTT